MLECTKISPLTVKFSSYLITSNAHLNPAKNQQLVFSGSLGNGDTLSLKKKQDKSFFSACKNILNTIFKAKRCKYKSPKVLDTTTGKMVKMDISSFTPEFLKKVKTGNANFDQSVLYAYIGNKEVGRMALSSGEAAGQPADNAKSLYIELLATAPGYKGIGREMIKRAVKISRDTGFDGNVDLMACTGALPTEYLKICGEDKCKYSAALIYRKIGFEPIADISADTIDEILKNGGTGLNNCYDTLSCPMKLSKETVRKFLK